MRNKSGSAKSSPPLLLMMRPKCTAVKGAEMYARIASHRPLDRLEPKWRSNDLIIDVCLYFEYVATDAIPSPLLLRYSVRPSVRPSVCGRRVSD